MAKAPQGAGMVILTHVQRDNSMKQPPVLVRRAFRAGDVLDVTPMTSLTEPETKSYITVGEKVFWLAETVDEVVAAVHAVLHRQDTVIERIAFALERIAYPKGGPDA